jgi:hypothetical protein
MSLSRAITIAFLCAALAISFSAVALGRCTECTSIFEVDPAVALSGFALFSGVVALLFETYRSRP